MKLLPSLLLALALPVGTLGQSPFEAAYLPPTQGTIRAVADVDGDGDMDLIGGELRQPIILWQNDGLGHFTAFPLVSAPAQWNGLLWISDWDGDGRLDLWLGVDLGASGGALRVYRQTASGALANPVNVALVTPPSFVRGADINGDGRQDALLCLQPTSGFSTGWVDRALWLVSGPGGYTAGPAVTLGATGVSIPETSLQVDDWNQDGLLDLLVLEGTSLRPFLSNAAGQLVLGTPVGFSIPGGANGHLRFTAIDLEGDGDRDLFLHHQPTGWPFYHYAMVNDGSGAFTFRILGNDAVQSSFPERLLAADLDGDGDEDIAVRWASSGGAYGSRIGIFANDGTGQFPLSRTIVSGEPQTGLLTRADLDGDGRPELVAAGEWVPFHEGWGPKDSDWFLSSAGMNTRPFDLDGDGVLDWLSATTFVTFRNDGTGNPVPDDQPYGTALEFVPPPASQVFLSEYQHLNGDQWPDVIVRNGSQADTWAGRPGGRVERVGPTFPGQPWTVVPVDSLTGDLDRDGDVDLILPQGVGLGFGDGTFALVPGVFGGQLPRVVADLNGDGLLDVVTSSPPAVGQGTTAVVWIATAGFLTFQPQLLTPNALVDGPMALADLDADGDKDLLFLVETAAGRRLLVYENQQGVMVARAEEVLPRINASGPARLLAGDVDGDGAEDVVVVQDAGRESRALLLSGAGAGPVGVRLDAVMTVGPSVHLVDCDGDGDLDLSGPVLGRGLRFSGPSSGSRQRYGQATTGSGGIDPVLNASGPFRPGETAVIRGSQFVGGAVVLITIGQTRVDLPSFLLPGVRTLVWPWDIVWTGPTTTGAPGAAGEGSFELPVAIPPALAGITFILQAATADPLGPSGVAASNGLEITIGQ